MRQIVSCVRVIEGRVNNNTQKASIENEFLIRISLRFDLGIRFISKRCIFSPSQDENEIQMDHIFTSITSEQKIRTYIALAEFLRICCVCRCPRLKNGNDEHRCLMREYMRCVQSAITYTLHDDEYTRSCFSFE